MILALGIIALVAIININENNGVSLDKARIVRIIDGDTFVAQSSESTFKIRLLYVDTPEFSEVGYTQPIEFAREYFEKNDWNVFLEYDIDLKDDYGRTLAVVYNNKSSSFEDSLNYKLWKYGLAEKMIIQPNHKYEYKLKDNH